MSWFPPEVTNCHQVDVVISGTIVFLEPQQEKVARGDDSV